MKTFAVCETSEMKKRVPMTKMKRMKRKKKGVWSEEKKMRKSLMTKKKTRKKTPWPSSFAPISWASRHRQTA